MAEPPVEEGPEDHKTESTEEDKPQSKPEAVNETALPEAVVSTTEQPETYNPQPITEKEMEIHHHSKTPRQKLMHYFWEFFMLFLAVTLGFFVENKREEYVEHHMEKTYMGMLVNDLAADTTELRRIKDLRLEREDMLDSLILLLGEKDLKENAALIYPLAERSDNYESFLRNDRTIQQLKTAGGMRMLRNAAVATAIMSYDNFIVSEVDWNNRTESGRIDIYKKERFQLFNAQLLNKLSLQKDTVKWRSLVERKLLKDTSITYSFPVLPAATINSIAGAVFQVKRISITCRESGDTASDKATQLIKLIKKEYDLEDDK
jgi:hypothetical protein